MTKKMLIDASHPEETRVVVTSGEVIEEFDFESENKKQLRGNIYLVKVTRVEPSLQAAFVEYGRSRQGFLAFSDIHPDYYQIPVADRQALLQAEQKANEDNKTKTGAQQDTPSLEEGEGEKSRRSPVPQKRPKNKNKILLEKVPINSKTQNREEFPDKKEEAGEDVVTLGAEDILEEVNQQRKILQRPYKIQEVIKRRQILLAQIVKEERGNKGASMTTYLSLAGRYSVLMPNTPRTGGVSRKITNPKDRERLKNLMKDLEIPQGMGLILRTAGENRTKAEIRRDYEYLIRLWEKVRALTLESTAPAMVYEEGNLIKRSIRDLYKKDINEILVSGEEAYRQAKDFIRMLMPSCTKIVKRYRDCAPIFSSTKIESLLDQMMQPRVELPSGGHIVINQTEALVAIDVNSGRSTREHSIENTALQTNLEAAEEIARQLRLRDLAGLIVIDFIDMAENQNQHAVEKKIKDCLKNDRARIQTGRISHFGLMEMSRQRIRASILESVMTSCPHCEGAGHIRPDSSLALSILRAIEEFLVKNTGYDVLVNTSPEAALYILNQKRNTLLQLEKRFSNSIRFETNNASGAQQKWTITKGQLTEKTPEADTPPKEKEEEGPEKALVQEKETPLHDGAEKKEGSEHQGRKRRRLRRRWRNSNEERSTQVSTENNSPGMAVNSLPLVSGSPEENEKKIKDTEESPGLKRQDESNLSAQKKPPLQKRAFHDKSANEQNPSLNESLGGVDSRENPDERQATKSETLSETAATPRKGWWRRKKLS